MFFQIEKESLLKCLQLVVGAVERRQTMAILGNVLIQVDDTQIQFTATDLEVELKSHVQLDGRIESGIITVPARKLMDIAKSLPDDQVISFKLVEDRMNIRAGKIRFSLTTMTPETFPNVELDDSPHCLRLPQQQFKKLLESTYFTMAQQDVRYFLNGLLLEIDSNKLSAVTTDGHRMSLTSLTLQHDIPFMQFIVPRKGVLELIRLLADTDDELQIKFSENHLRVESDSFIFTTKLIDSRYPDYKRVFPKAGDKEILFQRDACRQALSRMSILSNDKFRGVRLLFSNNAVRLIANNPEQEQAEEELEIEYQGNELEICFNVDYLLEFFTNIKTNDIRITLSNSDSSILIEPVQGDSVYVLSPMRL